MDEQIRKKYPDFVDRIENYDSLDDQEKIDALYKYITEQPLNKPSKEENILRQKIEEDTKNRELLKSKGTKGVAVCKSCGSDEVDIAIKQLRSGDEGSDVIISCKKCGKASKL